MHLRTEWILVVTMGLLVTGCLGLTKEEAKEAIEEATLSSQAVSLTGGTVEFSTAFTLGQAKEAALAELRAIIESQLPCAAVTSDGGSLRVEYGVDGTCLWRGQIWSGVHTVTIVSADLEGASVAHEWEALSNGTIEVSGTAEVTWSDGYDTRAVVHELQWRRLRDGREGVGSGDRVQRALHGDWALGVQVDGQREWDGESGSWDLQMEEVEARWQDPVPQSGLYTLDTPFHKSAELAFKRVDEDTIAVTVSSGRQTFSFHVTSTGQVTFAD